MAGGGGQRCAFGACSTRAAHRTVSAQADPAAWGWVRTVSAADVPPIEAQDFVAAMRKVKPSTARRRWNGDRVGRKSGADGLASCQLGATYHLR